jgi:hypothetical protein
MSETAAPAPATYDVAGAPAFDDPRLRAWVAFLQAHAIVTRRLEAELLAERNLSLADYDALVQLAVADDRRLRMSELAERVVLSRSGVSRLVDRLEAAGLDRLRDAAPVHLRGVDAHFLSPIATGDREGLIRALEAVVRVSQASDEAMLPACDPIVEALEP